MKNDGKIGGEATRILNEERRVEITRRIVRGTTRVPGIGAKTRRARNASDYCLGGSWNTVVSARRRLVNRNFVQLDSTVYPSFTGDSVKPLLCCVFGRCVLESREKFLEFSYYRSRFVSRVPPDRGNAVAGARTGRDESVELRRSRGSFHGTRHILRCATSTRS